MNLFDYINLKMNEMKKKPMSKITLMSEVISFNFSYSAPFFCLFNTCTCVLKQVTLS